MSTPSGTDNHRSHRKRRRPDPDQRESGQVVVTRGVELGMGEHVGRDVGNHDPQRHEEKRELPLGHAVRLPMPPARSPRLGELLAGTVAGGAPFL